MGGEPPARACRGTPDAASAIATRPEEEYAPQDQHHRSAHDQRSSSDVGEPSRQAGLHATCVPTVDHHIGHDGG
jgi:hypothetical protein